MSIDCIEHIPGASELHAWFGSFPSFHDANVLEFRIEGNGTGLLKVHAFKMTDKVDAKGYFILEKHVVVSFILKEITAVDLVEFMQGCILDSVNIRKTSDAFELLIESSYGFHGSLSARHVAIEYHPGET